MRKNKNSNRKLIKSEDLLTEFLAGSMACLIIGMVAWGLIALYMAVGPLLFFGILIGLPFGILLVQIIGYRFLSLIS